MKTVKIILWPILLFCLIWAGAIIFGPTLIISATAYFSEGKVNLTRVKVSPNLKFNAAVVDFVIPNEFGGKEFSGISRALSIGWEIKNGFKLIGSVGPSRLEKYGTLSSVNFTVEPSSIFDWRDLSVNLEFKQLAGSSFNFFQGTLSGKIINSFQDIKDVELTSPKIHGEVGGVFIEASEAIILVNNYQINQTLNQQISEITYSVKQILVPSDSFEGSLIYGDVRLENGKVIFNLLANEPQFTRQELKAKSLTISSRSSFLIEDFESRWDFSISEVESKSPAIQVEKYSGYVTLKPSEISHVGRAIISALEMKNNQYFFGKIENGVFDVALTGRVFPSRIDLEGQGVLNLETEGLFSADVSIETSISEVDMLTCLNRNCQINELEANYLILVQDASLSGELKCELANCFNRPSRHILQTDNTNKFFIGISDTGILSPLALPIAFMAISSGKALGDGHVLKF